jgi:hypothetical protein
MCEPANNCKQQLQASGLNDGWRSSGAWQACAAAASAARTRTALHHGQEMARTHCLRTSGGRRFCFDWQVYGIEIEFAWTRRRPKPARRVAPKQPDGEPSLFLFRVYEAAGRDLTHSAKTGPWRSALNFPCWPALDDWFTAANLNSALARPGQEPPVHR